MAALVRANSTESIPEADPTPEYDVVPNAADYILEGAAYKVRAGTALPYEKLIQGIPTVQRLHG